MVSADQDIQVRHAAAVASELLDNDEDGKVDDPNIEFALREDLAKKYLSKNLSTHSVPHRPPQFNTSVPHKDRTVCSTQNPSV